jgi:hypothetical protein
MHRTNPDPSSESVRGAAGESMSYVINIFMSFLKQKAFAGILETGRLEARAAIFIGIFTAFS